MGKSALLLNGKELCSGDKKSISIVWGNITGKNFRNQDGLDSVRHGEYIAQYDHHFNENKSLEGQLELVHGGQICNSIAIPVHQDRLAEGEGY